MKKKVMLKGKTTLINGCNIINTGLAGCLQKSIFFCFAFYYQYSKFYIQSVEPIAEYIESLYIYRSTSIHAISVCLDDFRI